MRARVRVCAPPPPPFLHSSPRLIFASISNTMQTFTPAYAHWNTRHMNTQHVPAASCWFCATQKTAESRSPSTPLQPPPPQTAQPNKSISGAADWPHNWDHIGCIALSNTQSLDNCAEDISSDPPSLQTIAILHNPLSPGSLHTANTRETHPLDLTLSPHNDAPAPAPAGAGAAAASAAHLHHTSSLAWRRRAPQTPHQPHL